MRADTSIFPPPPAKAMAAWRLLAVPLALALVLVPPFLPGARFLHVLAGALAGVALLAWALSAWPAGVPLRVRALAWTGGVLLALAQVAPPLPLFVKAGVALPALALLAAAFLARGREHPRASWVAALALAAVLALPLVPYAQRHCSDAGPPDLADRCVERGTSWRTLGRLVLTGQGWSQGDLSVTAWRAPLWALPVALAWDAAALWVAMRPRA